MVAFGKGGTFQQSSYLAVIKPFAGIAEVVGHLYEFSDAVTVGEGKVNLEGLWLFDVVIIF